MFNKTRDEEQMQETASRVSASRSQPSRSDSARPASLGPSISLSGNLTGSEDLIIEGSVEGEITVRDHKVTISETGKVKADIYGRSICVEGQVHGNLVGDEQVVIRQSGRVRGNVTAPRVNLENGAKFKGSIDMQPGTASSDPVDAKKAGEKDRPKKPAAVAPATKTAATATAPSTQSA